jgi:hypothetical protein
MEKSSASGFPVDHMLFSTYSNPMRQDYQDKAYVGSAKTMVMLATYGLRFGRAQ